MAGWISVQVKFNWNSARGSLTAKFQFFPPPDTAFLYTTQDPADPPLPQSKRTGEAEAPQMRGSGSCSVLHPWLPQETKAVLGGSFRGLVVLGQHRPSLGCSWPRQKWDFVLAVAWIIVQKYSVSSPTSREGGVEKLFSLIHFQLGHVTHLGQFSLLANWMLVNSTQLDFKGVCSFWLPERIGREDIWSS